MIAFLVSLSMVVLDMMMVYLVALHENWFEMYDHLFDSCSVLNLTTSWNNLQAHRKCSNIRVDNLDWFVGPGPIRNKSLNWINAFLLHQKKESMLLFVWTVDYYFINLKFIWYLWAILVCHSPWGLEEITVNPIYGEKLISVKCTFCHADTNIPYRRDVLRKKRNV